MATLTVRIGKDTHKTLRDMARQSGESMPSILAKAIEQYRREQFLQEANVAYAALRQNPKAWNEENAERAAWDATLADGLEDE